MFFTKFSIPNGKDVSLQFDAMKADKFFSSQISSGNVSRGHPEIYRALSFLNEPISAGSILIGLLLSRSVFREFVKGINSKGNVGRRFFDKSISENGALEIDEGTDSKDIFASDRFIFPRVSISVYFASARSIAA